MISIVISSVNAKQLDRVSGNINRTIGVPYEIIAFENAEGKYGIAEIYNDGVRKAKYDMLCFTHEDVEFHTNNWGKVVLNIFEGRLNLGLIGLSGSTIKSSVPGGGDNILGTNFTNLIQYYKFEKRPPQHICEPLNPRKSLNPVVFVDGVWFCCPKKIAEQYPFDETLKGFHGYDIDFSLAVGEAYEVAVTFDVLLSHYSEGNFSKEWLDAMLYIHRKRKKQLPKYRELYPDLSVQSAEKKTFKYLLRKYRDNVGITLLDGVEILNSSNIRSLGLLLYIKLYYYVIKILLFRK
ncbi:hypothetical protein JHJ32_01465 [Parapedobacter sp. ISTM3]|uniref:glycosyltransferase n=1 Tax=Parapedobacter sp. ISTM3 TaxID=2800130 RepID=UPI001904B9E5|nr:glycosyltransferase [Parapedobacter sp. ISTM3]MBK1438644.1 hypothetical protein [Parapedobacter sp. ISTM3]